MIKFVKLGDVCLVRRGTTITKNQTKKGNIPVIAGGKKATYFHNMHNREAGTITISGSGASAGLVNYWSNPIFASDCSTVELKDNKQNIKFVFYYMKSMQEFIYKNMRSGAAQPHVYAKDIANLNFPLLSNKEQEIIVTKLDIAFSELEKLVNLEIMNIKNIETVFTNFLSKIFLYKSNDDNEKEYEIGKICKIIGGGTPSKSNPEFYTGEIPWATVRDMKNDIIEKTQFKINKDAIIKSSTNIIPKKNIVIATRVGLGKVCILKNDTAINQDLKGIIPIKPKTIDVNYLFYWFKAISKIIIESGTGLTVQGVKLPFIKSLKISLPSINQQKSIINKIQSLRIHVNNIKTIKEKKIKNLELLKNLLLKDLININKTI